MNCRVREANRRENGALRTEPNLRERFALFWAVRATHHLPRISVLHAPYMNSGHNGGPSGMCHNHTVALRSSLGVQNHAMRHKHVCLRDFAGLRRGNCCGHEIARATIVALR
jgi:hypothetical protein